MAASPASTATTSPASKKRGGSARLMRNTPVGKKMAVVVGAMILPLLTLLGIYVWNQYADIKFVNDELEGLAYYHPLEEIGGAVNVRSAKLAMELSGGEAAKLGEVDSEIDGLMAEMDELDKKYGRPESSAKWRSVHETWSKLKGTTPKDLASSLSAHEAMVAGLADLRLHIATEWGMALDPYAETYYILDLAVNKIPELQNGVGTARGLIGASVHGAAESPEIRLEMIRHSSIIDDRISATQGALDIIKAKTAGDPAAKEVIAHIEADWIDKIHHWTKAVGVTAAQGKLSSADYQALLEEGNSIPALLDKVHDETMEAAHFMVAERAHGLIMSMIVGIVLVLLLCAASIKLAHAVSWRIIGAIRRLKEITGLIATGKFDNHLEADGSDEIA